MTVSLIVAMTRERVMGVDNTLPWHLPEDLKRFKAITLGHPIIMGRKTYDSIGRVLPKRQNIIVSRNQELRIEGADVVGSLKEAFAIAKAKDEVFVIGGAQLFVEALPLADRLYLTLIDQPIAGDTYFPAGWEEDFKEVESTRGESEGLSYTFLTAVRRP